MSGGPTVTEKKPLAALAYLFFFVSGLALLYVEPYNQDEFVRFHARQSIGFTIVWFGINVVLGVFIAILPNPVGVLLIAAEELVNLAIAVYWLYLMYRAYLGERYRIPELADIIDNVAGATP
ncbi:MAG: DUF4870 domain-containing protein [Candidatus Binataceae bacterium]